jgi:membrane protein YqaA with SNARE-associated domain
MSAESVQKVVDVFKVNSVERAKRLMRSRYGLVIMAGISFVESALPLPILTDPFLVAAILLHRAQAVWFIIVTTISSVVGGVAAYFMATFFLEFLLSFMGPGVATEFHSILNNGESSTLLITLVGAITPIPYTIVAWVLAVLEGSLIIFIIGSIIGRGLRYTIVGYSTYRFGPLAVSYAKRYVAITSVLLFIAIALYIWLKM